MNQLKRNLFLAGMLLAFYSGVGQDSLQQKSNIQQYTPSKLIGKGKVDVKWFNNLYTQTESTFSEGKEPRQSFFTATFEFYTGVGKAIG